jgi:hypothetical protein
MNARLPTEDAEPAPAYPRDLALLVRQRWTEKDAKERHDAETFPEHERALPELDVLERVVSICYQASLLQEEGRPITFRVALAEPESFIALGGAPEGFHRLVLSRFRPFDRHELRHLAPAAGFQRSLIGVHLDANGELEVWGLVHTGPRWLQAVRGGRRAGQSFPPVLMVAVTGPGRVLVSKGTKTIAALAGGTLADEASDVFAAPWLASIFADLHAAQWAEHSEAPEQPSEPYRTLEPAFGRKLASHVLRRIVATIRGARHGGTVILLPARLASELCADGRYLTLKYPFRDEEPRRRIFSLTVRIMNELAALHPVSETQAEPRVGWVEYEASDDSQLVALDEALFEVAHLIAMLADIDGAVVMTDRLEILGFGAEISGALPEVGFVDRSMDLQGTRWVRERTDRVGTRHRSAYRLCSELHEALALVVSQDGGVRFVRWHDERVTYFDQIATGPWEV